MSGAGTRGVRVGSAGSNASANSGPGTLERGVVELRHRLAPDDRTRTVEVVHAVPSGEHPAGLGEVDGRIVDLDDGLGRAGSHRGVEEQPRGPAAVLERRRSHLVGVEQPVRACEAQLVR